MSQHDAERGNVSPTSEGQVSRTLATQTPEEAPMSSPFGAVFIAGLIVSSVAFAGINASTTAAASTNASATIQVAAADTKISAGSSTTYTIELSNTNSGQHTLINGLNNVPDDTGVDSIEATDNTAPLNLKRASVQDSDIAVYLQGDLGEYPDSVLIPSKDVSDR